MKLMTKTAGDRDTDLENLAAELTVAAYPVALRMSGGANWLDLELGLWRTLTDTVKHQRYELSHAAP